MEALNKAWEGASQEMYAAAQGAEGGAQAGRMLERQKMQPKGSADDVSDVEYEEVKED